MAKKDNAIFQEKPTLRIYEAELPELKDWKIDDEYELDIKVKLVSLGKSEYEDNPKLWGTFQVVDVKTDDDEDPGIKGFKSVPITRRTKGS